LETPPWSEVTRLYRRICLLRAGGEVEAAARLHATGLSAALEGVPAGPDTAARLQELYAAEDERIANAFALARVLAPLLAEQRGSTVSPAEAPAPAGGNPDVGRPRAPGRPGPAVAPSIADFIDGMLDLERPVPHLRRRS
jgi:hypothetical protein